MKDISLSSLTLAAGLALAYPVMMATAHEGEQHQQDERSDKTDRDHANDGHHDGHGHEDHGHDNRHHDGDGHHDGGHHDDHDGHADGHHDGRHGAEGHGDDHHSFSFGKPGKPSDVDRTVKVVASDTDFDHETIGVTPGETVRFVLENTGQLVHEFTIGPPHMQKAHQREMAKMMERGDMTATSVTGGMEHAHANSVLLEPGENKEIIWTFAKAADVHFACNIPGHYEAGMHGEFAFRGSSDSQ